MVAVNYKFLEVTSSRGPSHGVEVTLLVTNVSRSVDKA